MLNRIDSTISTPTSNVSIYGVPDGLEGLMEQLFGVNKVQIIDIYFNSLFFVVVAFKTL